MNYTFLPSPACNMCGSASQKILGRRLNTAQGLRPKKRIGISTTVVKCERCGLVYADPLPIPENISDHYGVLPESYWHDDYFQVPEDHFGFEFRRMLHFAPNAETFLDIGSGIGKTLKAAERFGLEASGVEASEPFYSRAIERMGVCRNRLMLSTFESVKIERTFDLISFGVVLEHLYDPSACLTKALSLLNPGGVIHIEVPNATFLFNRLFNLYFWLCRTDFVVNISPMHVPFHLYEFTEESFRLNGQRLGYSIAHIDRYTGSSVITPRLSKLLSPIMAATKTGAGLVLYLQPLRNVL